MSGKPYAVLINQCSFCTDFPVKEREIEMEKVHCYQDSYNEKGEHVEIDLGYIWVCPECEYEEGYIEEEDSL